MKLNMKTFKVLFAFVLIIGTLFWAIDSLRVRSYSGMNLNFLVGNGPVTMTNPLDVSIPVQLISVGSRTFSILSGIEGAAGTSIRQGSGSGTTQLFEFRLPPGTSEFTISRGKDVSFVSNSAALLQGIVNPVTNDMFRTTLIVAVVVILGAIFFASYVTDHRWIGILRRQEPVVPDLMPVVESAVANQGHAARSYGDNRKDTSA